MWISLQHWLVPSSPCRVMSFHVMILSIACKVDVVGWSPSDHEYLEEDYLSAEWVSPRVAASCRPTSHCCSGVRGLCCVAAASLSHACTASLSLCCHMCHSWVATCCSHLASMTGLRSSSAQNWAQAPVEHLVQVHVSRSTEAGTPVSVAA